MNLVDPVLRTSNSGAVLAAVNCFLLLTKDMPDMRYQVRSCSSKVWRARDVRVSSAGVD